MKRPDAKTVQVLAKVQKTSPELANWLRDWYMSELEALPNVRENVAVAQGRCRVLRELLDTLEKSPDWAVESR